jgi:hypothetical protein
VTDVDVDVDVVADVDVDVVADVDVDVVADVVASLPPERSSSAVGPRSTCRSSFPEQEAPPVRAGEDATFLRGARYRGMMTGARGTTAEPGATGRGWRCG